jgi:hypothetical protein
MKFIRNLLICVLLVSLAFITGCTQPPTEEMNNAEEAVARAENDPDAVTYASNLIQRAKETLALMYEESNAKRYEAAKNYAAEAITLAERAIDEGLKSSLRTREEAIASLAAVRPLLLETENRIENAKAAKLPLDYGTIDRDFNSARGTYDQAQSAISNAKYQEAVFLSNNVRSSLAGINQKLGTTAMTVSRKK